MAAVAVFTGIVEGEVLFQENGNGGCKVTAKFTKLPSGLHGFHIHKGGDLRGEGCLGACEHYHVGPPVAHGGPPSSSSKKPRHTGDLGNISDAPFTKRYVLENVKVSDLYGRSVIVHEDEDDLGLGYFEDSATTGHSGARIACAIIGRVMEPSCSKTRKSPEITEGFMLMKYGRNLFYKTNN
jgi:Cu-Zn family superoxide dismutase